MKRLLMFLLLAAVPATGQLGYTPTLNVLGCYNASLGWIAVATGASTPQAGYVPPLIGAVGVNGTSYYPLACDTSGNLILSGGTTPIVLPNGSTATTTPNSGDSSTRIATDAFVTNALQFSQARFPMNITGGTYSFDSQGTGAQVVIFVTGGAVSSILTIANPGNGYAVGDLLFVTPGGAVGGNGDAVVRVTSVSGTGVSAASVIYGGTGYTATGLGSTTGAASGRPYTFIWQGAVTSTVQIIMKFGTYLTTSNQWIMANNTTGAAGNPINVCEGNAFDMCGGGLTVNLYQGTANSRQVILETDGELNMYLAAIQNSLDLQFTEAAASNCNQSGVLTAVTGCMPVSVGSVTHYVPVF